MQGEILELEGLGEAVAAYEKGKKGKGRGKELGLALNKTNRLIVDNIEVLLEKLEGRGGEEF